LSTRRRARQADLRRREHRGLVRAWRVRLRRAPRADALDERHLAPAWHGRQRVRRAAHTANPNGGVAGTVNDTHEASPADDCDPSDDSGNDFYGAIETGQVGGTSTSGRQTAELAQWTFTQFNNRYGCTGATIQACGMPNDFGVPGVDSYVPLLGNTEQWESNNVIPGSFGGTGVPFNR